MMEHIFFLLVPVALKSTGRDSSRSTKDPDEDHKTAVPELS